MYVETFYIDRELDNLRIIVTGRSTLNTNATAEHVLEIE